MSEQKSRKAIIIGGGPGGLTAAYEFLQHTDIKPFVLEKSANLGGISQTIDYKGNKIDIGGHRFFSKSDRVMNWWLSILPIESGQEDIFTLNYQNRSKELRTNMIASAGADEVMLVRNRLSRILFLRKLFDYPLGMNLKTIRNLGILRLIKIGWSYSWVQLFPIKEEKSLEDFFINRFGKELYHTFFKDYTEKVWGQSCKELDASWGAQRIKGLSVWKAITHAAKAPFRRKGLSQKNVETSLIERFLYPKFGPGQMWQKVGRLIGEGGGEIVYNKEVVSFRREGNQIKAVLIKDAITQKEEWMEGDYFISTMPIKDLMKGMEAIPSEISAIGAGLVYRDFMTVGLLLKNLTLHGKKVDNLPDTWIYVQEKDVKVGRIQFFNNWSPYMVKDTTKAWIGLEYFVNEGEELWCMDDDAMIKLALDEMERIGLVKQEDCLDAVVIRMPKAYPAYTGSYKEFDKVKTYLDTFENLFLVGRNGMHRYNNQDHSMLTAMLTVENIKNGVLSKEAVWEINTEQEYHEEK